MHLIDADFNLKCTVAYFYCCILLLQYFYWMRELAQHHISSSRLLGN